MADATLVMLRASVEALSQGKLPEPAVLKFLLSKVHEILRATHCCQHLAAPPCAARDHGSSHAMPRPQIPVLVSQKICTVFAKHDHLNPTSANALNMGKYLLTAPLQNAHLGTAV